MRKARVDGSLLLLILILILLVSGVLFMLSYLRQDPVKDFLGGDKAVNTLFVIENASTPGERSAVKPLCSYVLMYYPPTKRAAVIDVPGSLGLIIQRINRVDRIDTVYDPRRIVPFENEIEKLLGLEISFSVVITLENLGKVTDLIEGVDLFIPSAVDEYQDEHILFPSGANRLDGDKAKLYISYELPEESSELSTFRRQRFFIGLIKRLGEQNLYLKNPEAGRIFHSLVKTGVNQKTQMRLFDEFSGIDVDRVSVQSVGGDPREVSGQILIFPHWDGSLIKEITRQTVGGLMRPMDSALGDRVFTVEVLNGTTVSGLAGRTAELFRGFGYDIISIGNAGSNDYEKTMIIDRSGFEDMVKDFADIIRCNNISFEKPDFVEQKAETNLQDLQYKPELTLIIGKDFNGRYISN